jgi:hypothetical protein
VLHTGTLPSFLYHKTTSVRTISSTALCHATNIEYEGVPSSIAEIINNHAHQPQTSVSLQALMRTGRGEFLHKHFDEEKLDVEATELVLIQVNFHLATLQV